MHRGKDATQRLFKLQGVPAWPEQCCKNCVNGSNIVAPHFGDHGTKQMGQLLAEKFDVFQTSRNNRQQHETGCVNGRNMLHSTMLGVVGQQCCVPSHGASGVTLNPFFDSFLRRVAFYLFWVHPHRFDKSVRFPSVGRDR